MDLREIQFQSSAITLQDKKVKVRVGLVKVERKVKETSPVDLLVEDGVPHDGPACKDDQRRDEKADQTLPTNPKLLINCWVDKLIKN